MYLSWEGIWQTERVTQTNIQNNPLFSIEGTNNKNRSLIFCFLCLSPKVVKGIRVHWVYILPLIFSRGTQRYTCYVCLHIYVFIYASRYRTYKNTSIHTWGCGGVCIRMYLYRYAWGHMCMGFSLCSVKPSPCVCVCLHLIHRSWLQSWLLNCCCSSCNLVGNDIQCFTVTRGQ